MASLIKILNIIFIALFIEAILFIPMLILIATGGMEIGRIMKYAVPFLIAVLPYFLFKRIKHNISDDRRSIIFMIIGTVTGICFLVFLTGLMFACCSGHPPF